MSLIMIGVSQTRSTFPVNALATTERRSRPPGSAPALITASATRSASRSCGSFGLLTGKVRCRPSRTGGAIAVRAGGLASRSALAHTVPDLVGQRLRSPGKRHRRSTSSTLQ
jgi:hypothetical protein